MEAETPAVLIQDNLLLPVSCDLCEREYSWQFLPESRQFGSGNVWVCGGCGFVVVPKNLRRSSEEIAKSWETIFGDGYSSRWPAVEARLRYVAELYDQRRGWKGKQVLEIGAGEGRFLDIAREMGASHCGGIEPYAKNCERIKQAGHTAFLGTAEQAPVGQYHFDVVVILWTLENCQDCLRLLEIGKRFLCQGGSLIVATGSRILVPFKKPLSTYFSTNSPDTHSFRFSAKSLVRALNKSGFNHVELNDYQQCDWLVAEAQARKNTDLVYQSSDDPQEVLDYFRRWGEQFP
jgi:ubiquinone/menaquinone biosynthesis C-methylase UbiE